MKVDGSANITVRLQVWHYDARGRCPEFNNGLAQQFLLEAFDDLHDWAVHPADIVEPVNISIRDEYVPVEVDFVHAYSTYNNPRGNPASGVRDIFNKFAPPIVHDYFISNIQSPPNAMNIYAIANGQELTESHFKLQYAHSFLFIPLELRLERFVKPAGIRHDDAAKKMLRMASDSLPTLGSLIFAYMAFQGAKVPEGIDFTVIAGKSLEEAASKMPWLKDMVDSMKDTGRDSSSQTRSVTGGSDSFLKDATTSFEDLRQLSGGLKPRLMRLATQDGLTNEGIIKTIHDLRQATIYFSDYAQAMESFNSTEIDRMSGKANHYETLLYGGGAATIGCTLLAFMALWSPEMANFLASNLASCSWGLGGLASGTSTIHHYREMKLARKACDSASGRATTGRKSFKKVLTALQQVQLTVALIFIVQVMRQPIENMGYTELERTVKMLGADLSWLDCLSYHQESIQDRVSNLMEQAMNLDMEFERFIDEVGLIMSPVGRVIRDV